MSIRLLASLVSLALGGCVTDQQSATPATSVAAPAAQTSERNSSWNGTWVGAWGQGPNASPSAFTVVNGQIIDYQYRGRQAPLDRQEVNPTTINFGSQQFTVQVTRIGPNTASASYKGSQGTATGTFTRQ